VNTYILFIGLKVNYIRELHKGVQEIFNPFPTIAVWAAVKFVHKKEHDRLGILRNLPRKEGRKERRVLITYNKRRVKTA
jgi:hypothetical protein